MTPSTSDVTASKREGEVTIQLPDLVVQKIVPDGSDGFMFGYERNILIGLMNLIQAETVIEIGVQRGQCARLLLDHVSSIRTYWGIDVEAGHKTTLPQQQAEVAERPGELVIGDPRFHLVLKPYGSMSITVGALPMCDAIIIDGDHSAVAVRYDTLLAEASVRPGGLILWHDYAPQLWHNDVNDFIDSLRASGRDIRHIPDTWLAMEIV